MLEAVVALAEVLVAVEGCVCECAYVCMAEAVWVVNTVLHPCADTVRRRLFWSSFYNRVMKSANSSGSFLVIRSFFNSWHKPSSSCDLLATSFHMVLAA